ncbi:MAG: hypothetical protein ACO1O6_12875 [Bacteroidota bacterium]
MTGSYCIGNDILLQGVKNQQKTGRIMERNHDGRGNS